MPGIGYHYVSSDIEDELEPLCALPAQWFEPRDAEWSAEQRLMAAVLEEAAKCVEGIAVGTSSRGQRGAFAFEPICHRLGLDPQAVRRRVLG